MASKAKPSKGMDGDVDLFLGQCHETRQKNLGLMLQVYIRTQHLSTGLTAYKRKHEKSLKLVNHVAGKYSMYLIRLVHKICLEICI